MLDKTGSDGLEEAQVDEEAPKALLWEGNKGLVVEAGTEAKFENPRVGEGTPEQLWEKKELQKAAAAAAQGLFLSIRTDSSLLQFSLTGGSRLWWCTKT